MSDPHARQRFLDGMSTIAAGVHVVTTDGPEGWAGVTVTAMTSVSADGEAPTLLVCLHHQSAAAPLILGNKVFCVNVLRADQAHVSDAFAGRFRQPNKDKFATGSWTTMRTGAPRLANPLAAFDCALVSHHQVGTHVMLLGAVQESFVGERGGTLLYFDRGYHAPMRLDAHPPTDLAGGAVQTAHKRGPLARLREAVRRRPPHG